MTLTQSLLDPLGAASLVFALLGILYPLVVFTDKVKHGRSLERGQYWQAWKVSFWLIAIVIPSVFLFADADVPRYILAWLGAYAGWLLAGVVLWLLRNKLSFVVRHTYAIEPDGRRRWLRD